MITGSFQIFPVAEIMQTVQALIKLRLLHDWRSLERAIMFPEIVCRILVHVAFSLGRGKESRRGPQCIKKKKYYVERSIKLLSPSEISFCLLLIVTGITSCIH